MMKNKSNWWFPLAIFAFLVCLASFLFSLQLAKLSVDYRVVIGANILLCLVSTVSIAMQQKSVENPNPHAAVRSVMAGSLLKLFVIAIAAFLYLLLAGEGRSVYAIFVAMLLYIVYAWLEVSISLKLKRKG